MFDEQDRQYFYNEFKNNGYEVGSYDDFKKDLNNEEDRNWYYNEAKNMGYDVGTQADFDKMVLEPAPSTSGGGKQVDASATTQSVEQKASTETKPQVAQPAKKQETTDKEPGLIAKVLDMIPTGVQTSNGTYQPSPEIPQPVVKGEEMPVKEETSSSSSDNAASPESKEAAPVTTPTGVVNNESMMDAKLANYLENWKQRPDKQSTYFENLVADLLADGTANSNEEAVSIVKSALGRYANRSAMDVTNQVVSSLPDDTVQDAEKSIEAQWYSHGVQDKLKQEAYNMGISYDDYVGLFLKPAMVQSLVNKYGPKYRDIAEGIATRLYSHDENVQDRLMNQDINDALSSVISKYVNPSVVDEYNKAQEAGSKAFTEGMEGSQFIPANLRLGTALGAQYEANEAKDPAKVLSSLQKKFGNLYRNPKFLNDMSNAAFKVMQRYGLNGTQSSDPKQFKPMINSVLKNELDQLEIKGMMPKGSAEYIMKTGLGNTIVGKITRKAVQTDYQNWLEDIANQQYQPGFWENVASGALTFAGDAWSYWLPGAAGGKLTKSMVAKAEGKLAGDLMAKGMERKMAERAAKVLIGKSKTAALKSGAAHGAVTFGGQSAISKPIDEIYRTGQFDENGKIYNPSVGKVIANTLGEVAKQSAVGAIMQGGTIANMVGKGRGLATNILADIGGKVVDSGIMTGQQLLERMAHDPNFKPTGKDAAETFLESGANLLSIGFPGFVGKYARFKDAREFNKKFDFSDQDIAELKRFGYDGLRDAFEKMGIGEYAVVGENAQRLDGQLTQKYMDLMNDKSVPEVLKAKMMAVVEGKRPSSFSPIVDSIIVQPMDNDGKVYLETLNKNGGIVERKEFASLDEAQKADKKLEYEKTLGLASVLEGEFHNEFTQEHLDGLYNKAAQKYNMGEKLTDEDKAAVYLHQNAGAIKEIMDKQQKGIILTDEEQKQVNAYRHYYDSALENSSVMREFVNTFEDSHGVARGTLRKALESKDKKYAPLVESYLKELYNSIELKREMKQIEDDKKRIEQGDVDGAKTATPVEGPASVEGSAGGQEPPVSEEPAPYQDRTNSVPTPSDAEVAANPANSAAEGAGNEPKVASSDAFVMGQNAYKNGDSEALQAIDYNSDLATGRLKRVFADNEKMPDIVANAYNEGRDMEQFVAQRASSLTPAQKEAISKYVEAMDAKNGAIDALQHADDGYGDALKEQLWPYQTEDGNIVPATLDSGKQVFLKKANEYGGAFVVVPDEQGQPTIKQVSNAEIKEMGTPVSLDEYIESSLAQQKEARAQQFISQFDGSGLKPNDQVTVAMEEGDANINMTFAGYSKDGKIVLTDGKDYLPLSKEEFAAWRKNALDNTINEHLDAEDDEREQAQIKKAEADKQERYKKGIFGYAAGKPDYSDTQTDPKVAAEYLQETAGEDRKALFANIVAEKQALQKRISQLREHIANNEEWLSVNADLDPENAETRSLANKQMRGQIVDLQARFDNWNKIRSSVMTPEEAEAIKADRTKKIAEAGVNDGDVAPVEGREIAVLSDEELKKQYPTMDEASSYITSERKKIYRIQSDEVQREIDGVDEVLDRYVNGEIDLEPEQLKELNTTKAQLQARQQNLTESAKDLKAQADKLKTLYRKENMEARAKAVENMTPAEQRAVKVENAIKNGNLSQLNSIYEEVRGATDFTDTEPNTIEEYVANNIGRFSLNYEGKDKAGVLSNGIKQETGLGRKDFDKLQILAKEGEGKTVPEFVHSLYDNMPEQLKQMGYSDQDIRDAFLNLISSVENYSDLKNYTLNNKVAEAEQQLRTLEHQEEEMMEEATSDEINDEAAPFADRLETAISETETEPTEAQKKAGNYKKGHLSFGGYDYTVETPKGVTRSGKDEQGKPWSVTMHDTYGYILGKIGVDGDHIDMFINDAADLDTFDGNVYVVDQVNPETGEFDEHKVMYGYPDEAAATKAYLSNYSKGWKGLGKVTSVPKATFDKWLESSDRKTKPFRDYAIIQHEEAKKAKQANEALPFDAPMSMDDLPFHRDVKEVKPENLTEAQKVAYDTVSTMLKKAGIPVKVVSNEDMEKVAEAQDNLVVEMLLNDPRLRFYIKTPEQKEAAKAAYDWAAKNRPDKFKQYAIVNMDNPNQPPQYFEKKDLAEKWRKYYTNAWKIGNYKAFNLNKPFEEQIKDVKGDVPSEFDPYKAESLLNKRIELEKQIKETEDSYNAKKKERAEYQNQLMQDYMDQHGLSSENDIPDDVWTDYRDKSFEKYQDTLDDLFHKYVELDNQLKAVAEPGVRFLRTYHGSGASFDKFDLSHALEGEGSETFGHGVYVTSSREIGREYAQRAKQKKMANLYKTIRYPDGVKGDTLKRRLFGEMVNDVATGGDVASAKEFAKKRVGADANDVERTLEHLKDREKGTEYEQNLKDGLAKYKDALKWIDSLDDDYLSQGNATRYEVEIPEDNGSNYLEWEGKVPDSLDKQKVVENAYKVVSDDQGFKDYKATPLNDFIAHTLKTYVDTTDVAASVEKLKSDIKDVIEDDLADDDVLALNEYLKDATPYDVLATIWYNDLVRDINNAGTGEELYRKLSTYVGDNAASQILSDNGLVGIKYPAGMIHGGAKEGDYNYVVFDETNANIVGNTKFAQGKGVVYGYTDGKQIVLNQEHLNPNTPIHEYQHLWRTAAKEMNPELIEHGDKLIMQTQLFADLKQDPNYNHLTDEQICDEAFARLTGEDGAAILEQMAKDAIKENPLDTAKELSVINKLKEWLKKFWYWTLDTFTKWKPEDIKKMTLEDIRNLVLRDLANGVDPRTKVSKSDITKENVELEEVNKTFNQRLDELVENPNQKDKILRLGRSSSFLKAGGIADAEIELEFDKFVRKSGDKYKNNHPFAASDLKNLPMALAEPIAVFNSTTANDHVVLTELQKDGKNFIVAVRAVEQHRKGGVVLEVNKITSLYPKEERGIVYWINNGRISNLDKEKALHFIEALQPHAGTTITDEELKSAANIINSFETTKENGKKFSLEDPKTLAGVHNITEEKLRKALKLGGLANPSLAVIDTSKSAHDNFGEISFIAPSALLDKRTGKTGGTWITDAYTQRYPSVEREMSEKGYRKFEDWVDSLDYPSGAKAEIERQAKDALSDNNAPAWELMYLKEKGIDIKAYDSNVDYRWKEIISDHPTAEDILNSMKTDPELNEKVTSLAKHAIIHPTWEKVSLEVRRKIYKETGVKKSPISPIVRQQTKEIFERDYKSTLLNKDGSPRKKDVKKVVEQMVKEHNDTKKYDFYLSKVKASNYVNKNGLYDDYIRWQENKLDEFGTKNRIFRGYTRDGSRKYVPETLENVSKVMREEADGQTNGSEYTSFGSFIAKLASRVDSTDEMRANKDKLSSNKDKEEFYEKWESVYYDLAKSLYNDVFYGEQRLHDIVSQADPKKYAKKEYGITLSSSFMKKLDSFKNAVQNDLKSAYFETKFNRPVHLNEFVAAVVPNNLGEDVRKGLEESGLSLYDYDPEKEGDRNRAFNEAINSNNEIRFHRVTEPEELERLNKEKTFRMYSGMQEVDGKLYSPMAAIIDGKRTDATEIGAWMGADERPDLVKNGKFQLVKTDKNPGAGEGPVPAAYNPYMHTSTSVMNDQFSGAYARGNIKVVEWEIPESEKTSGYHAVGAKDSVGLVPWTSGTVNSLLPKDRQRSVMLSRWRKAVRIVPDEEVAEKIAAQLSGTGLAIPWNVVTPNQLRELAKLGVPITTVEQGRQNPEVKEKFLKQMADLKKEFPQAQFVDVKMTKDAFKEWGGKGIVKSPIMEQKLKKHPDSLMKAGTYFSGGGLVEEGLKGIIDPVVAVEYDRKISGVYRNNFGQHIVTADVRDVDPKELVKHIDGEVEYFHASPVCKNYSQAKSNGGEVELDKETAKSTADFIDSVKPRVVTIENVKGYKDSEAMNIITKALDKNGYTWDSDVYNAADYGGYTNRERLIVRAVKDGELPEKPKKQPRKGGWLEAVEDILPTLTVKESGVAPWMDARLKADGIDWQKVEKPLYVMGSAYADGKIPHAYGDEILPTLRTKSGDVIIMPGGKVLRADGRVLARITGLGDDYKLPKTESLSHTIIGNGIPVQLTQGVIAPLLNKDDLSGRNVLARLGSSIFKNNWDADKQKQVSDRVVNTANKLGGAEATVYTSVDEVPDAYLSDVKNGATGWYDPTTHTVHVYLPNCADANEAERTVLHEKIGHEGMEVLLGGEDGVRKFANFVYRSVGKDVRGKIIDFANKYDPDWKIPDRMNVGTQEYIAHLAEEGPKTAEDFSLWTKIKHYLIKLLKKLGVRVPGLLNDKDLRYYLMKAGKALHVWDEMPQEKQEAMMKQASNAEIKDALSDGAGKGKPRQKKGESTIQYMKRVQEWRKWQNAREDKENPEPPMFYDIDKDEAGKKEWAQLNKDWRERHHLVGEEPTGMPIRMENEEDDAYMNRIHEYENWQAAMKDQEDPLPDMFAFEKKKQEEVKRKYEDWLAKHDLLEQQQADLDLYEGKIYPAETNPKADALEQQVMQDLAEVTSTDVSKEGAAKTVKHAVIHRRKNMEEASADDAIYINDVKNRIEKMADSGVFDKLLSDYKGKKNRAEKLAETIPYIIEAPRRLRDMAHNLNATGVFDKGHIHIQPADVEAIQPYVTDLITETAKKHTEIKKGKEIEVYDDPKAVSEVASKMAQAINANHQGEEGFVPIDGSDILSEHVLPLVKQQIVPEGIDYKNLSPEMKAAIDSIRDWYNYTYDWLKDNHTLREDTGYNADYVNHIWDKEKSDKQAYAMYVENRQRTKSPNEKPRTISTLMEGIYAGLVPKTTDITKMMAYYSRSNIEAWANKTMLQELTGLNVIERNEKGEVISTDPLLSSSAPFNLEQYKYFEIPGVGPVWVYNVSPKQVKVKNPITDNEKVLYSEASAGDRFGVVFDTYQSSPFWKTFDTLASSAKKLELGFSGFHAGALTEVYMVQNMVEFGPKKAMANFMKYIFADTAKNHELPCFANPEDFQEAASHLVKFGATNDYAAADVQNMFDNMRDAMMKVQEKLKDGNKISGTVAAASMPLTVATQMLSLINKGMDRALWDFLHDGLKLATYRMRADKTKERAKKKGWTEEELSRALDEDGQFVNDMFGGQHWDVLGASHRTLRYAGRVLLSPDWNASTTRHFLALTGFGSIWNEATFENFKQYYKRLKHKELTPEDEGRRSRQISALLCYGIGFMVFYEGIANGINAAFRALDEEKERKKADEIRKTNPSYKSMYELAYGDEGMKWYDYLMRGNSLGQQSKIFLGRYEDGTEMYVRHGKQFREVPEYLFNHKGELEFPGPMVQRMIGKANPMVRMTLDDINYLSDFQASHADQEIQRKYGKTIGLLYKDALYWAPFLIPSQENKEFKAVDFFFPSSKGFSPWKAQSYFKDFILSGDMEGVVMTYQSCQRNGIDPEAQIKAAIGSVKALESAEMSDGVTSLQEASKRFDAAKSITEKKKMRQKMKKFLSQSDYKAFTQKEALDMVQGYLNGDEDLKEMEKAESKYLMKAKAEDVTEDWRIQNVWNGTMQTYQEYQRLKDVDKAKANAFKNSKTNKRLFAARKAISAARRKMNKAKKQMDGTNDAAKLVEIRNARKELLKKLNGME